MTEIRIVDTAGVRDQLGEGLLWSARDGVLYWTDIIGKALNRLSLASGTVDRIAMPEMIGWVIERDSGGLIAGMQTGFHAVTLDPLAIVPMLDPEPDLPENRLNDAKADAEGRIYAGTMPLSCDVPSGALYRLDPDGTLHTLERDIIIANGPAISPDGATFYHTDTGRNAIYRYDRAADGSLSGRALFIDFDRDWGSPDGMTTDAEGHLWVAHWGGSRISRFAPDGSHQRSIALPASQITNIAFAGPDLDRMFVTSAADGVPGEADAGRLFEVLDPGVRGLRPGVYAG
ncbi:SMP-30/gluconolactonase/LRE family protein [Sphingomonas japonica]|uniref:Sugar lactone lactonase YvrE n=1 Tax=Sphingomonas japonica TaxID=511662 RepID=A0ABX0U3P8_9SPHN|nr:SMP-30/gluconolactonase/LRE family protein [Sphingomonas japonica]NIJ23402.1 sugar lactone lactonase YvrE [Sphingomonas japonica]